MRTRFLPIAGAILNIFFFGLPDLLVGRILSGLFKLSLEFLIFPFCLGMVYIPLAEADKSGWASKILLGSLTFFYFVFVAVDGYKTFKAAMHHSDA